MTDLRASHSDHVHPFDEWRGASGIFVLINLRGGVAERIREIQRRYDPRLAAFAPPHITLIGSSGAGPIAASTPREQLRRTLEAVTRDAGAIRLAFDPPVRFLQTDTIALPLDPHGPLRALHERIKTSGLPLGRSRHAFTPHVTLSLYRTPDQQEVRELLSLRVSEPVVVDHIAVSLTEEPYPPRPLFELPLG
ncbi:MAG TPA: 2'-5' RNA ligase family protein [Gemmatimonadaceae bacterium]|nr:2'-5' RNA ligase family protein [Gemmatimonadaceae bacterium]